MAELELDGIFHGNDMNFTVFVDFIQDCRERGRFSGAGWAVDDYQAAAQMDQPLELLQQMERAECGENWVGNDAHGDGIASALRKDVDSETPEGREENGKVAGALSIQARRDVGAMADEVAGDAPRVIGKQRGNSQQAGTDGLSIGTHFGKAHRREKDVADIGSDF